MTTSPTALAAKQRPLTKVYLGNGSRPIAPLNAITQSSLRFLGYYSGPIDNRIGAAVRSGLQRFQSNNGLPVTGQLNRATYRKMDAAVKARIKSRAGKSLDGKWAKPGECSDQAFEIRDHMILRGDTGRLSTPRLDFFELGADKSFKPMINAAPIEMLISRSGKISERREADLMTPKIKPGKEVEPLKIVKRQAAEVDKKDLIYGPHLPADYKAKTAKSEPLETEPVETGPAETGPAETESFRLAADGTLIPILKVEPEPKLIEKPLIPRVDEEKASALSDLKDALAELVALANGDDTTIDESALKPLEQETAKPASEPISAKPAEEKPAEIAKTTDGEPAAETVKPDEPATKPDLLTDKNTADANTIEADIAVRPKLKPAYQRKVKFLNILEYQRCS